MANAKHLITPAGLVQITNLVFGAISIGTGAASYESEFFKERFFLWSVVAVLILSLVLLLILVITENSTVRTICSGLHIIVGGLLLAAGSLMILSVRYIDKDLCSPNPWGANCGGINKPTKLAAASFAIITGIFSIVASALLDSIVIGSLLALVVCILGE